MARTLLTRLSASDNLQVTTLSRKDKCLPETIEAPVKQLFCKADFTDLLTGIDVVIHTAARAHILKEDAPDPLSEYRKVNVDFTMNLARQAAAAGAKRFIYISSIGVHGITSKRPISVGDKVAPAEPYSVSKWEAEKGLAELCYSNSMELVIIRPPLIYGRGAPGNFGSLVKWISRGYPLPLGAVDNQRSLVSIDNLVDLIVTCIDHPAAAGKVLLASDGDDVSTTELLRRVARAMGKPSRLIPVPPALLRAGAAVLGKESMATRLLGSLQVDISRTTALLGWTPPYSLDEGLRRCFNDPAV
jgi:nucleoside-diphosphate-sugar epimerase